MLLPTQHFGRPVDVFNGGLSRDMCQLVTRALGLLRKKRGQDLTVRYLVALRASPYSRLAAGVLATPPAVGLVQTRLDLLLKYDQRDDVERLSVTVKEVPGLEGEVLAIEFNRRREYS